MNPVGFFEWRKGMRGFVASKRSADRPQAKDEAPPVASYPLNAEQFGMSIAILEQRFLPPKEAPVEKVKLEAQS